MARAPRAGDFQKGNRFWEARSSRGPKFTFETPEDFWAACVEYFEWVADNPLIDSRPVMGTLMDVPKMRAMTIDGLCNFLDISRTLFYRYEAREEFKETLGKVHSIIRQQKFEGAAADLFNSNIIARELGLADKRELGGPNGGPIQTEDTGAGAKLAALIESIAERS